MRIHPLDLAIVIAYLLGVTAFGIHFRRGQKDARDYFLGGRTAPWWALAFSIVATETSTLTIIGTPAISYGGNLTFLQLVFGYLIGRILIVVLLLPGYFRGEFLTAYALIEKRFGERMRAVAASTSIVSTPAPARPITRRRGAESSSSAVTRVSLRTRSASAVPITRSRAARSPVTTSTRA